MYSISLEQISLTEFKNILTSITLLPGRRVLLTGLDNLIHLLTSNGIDHLEALRQLLKNKAKYGQLAEEYKVSVDYLVVLNREINSYLSKPNALLDLDLFSTAEIGMLKKVGISNTKELFEKCQKKKIRVGVSNQTGVSVEKLIAALEMSDLLRINGVGPLYARILQRTGIRNVRDYRQTDSTEILARFEQANQMKQLTKTRLGLSDIDYCKRFCDKLTDDIEWGE